MKAENGSIANIDLISEFLQERTTKIYQFFLYILQISSLIITVYLTIIICSVGLSAETTDYRANEDAVRLSGFFVSASATITMFVGIKGIRNLDDREQYRFTTFLRVLLELMSVLFLFYGIIALTFNVVLEYYMLIGLGVHTVLFFFVYLKAREFERLLSSKRRNQLKEDYFRFNNNS
jgi:ABC-type antimicrobial peptide transport system permease subunit